MATHMIARTTREYGKGEHFPLCRTPKPPFFSYTMHFTKDPLEVDCRRCLRAIQDTKGQIQSG